MMMNGTEITLSWKNLLGVKNIHLFNYSFLTQNDCLIIVFSL